MFGFKKKDKGRESTRESTRESSRESSRASARSSKLVQTKLARTISEPPPTSHDEVANRNTRSTTSTSMLNEDVDLFHVRDASEVSHSRSTETSFRSTDSYNHYRTTTQFRSTAMSALDELEEVGNDINRGTAVHARGSNSSDKVMDTAAVDALHAELTEMKEEMQAIKREMMNEMHTTRYDMLKEVTMLKGTIMQLVSVIQQSGNVQIDPTITPVTEQPMLKPSETALQVMSRQPSRVSSQTTKERITTTREDLIAPVFRQSSRLTQLVSVDDNALSAPLDQDQLDEMFPLVDCTNEVQIMSQIRDSSTREWVFERVQQWLDSRFEVGADMVLAIVGGAGSGKSVAAASICDKFCDQVVAQHFCKFDKKVKSSPRALLLSLVNQLTGSLPSFKNQLARLNLKYVLDETDTLVLARKVLLDPLNALEEPLTGKLIVIDGIDQCRQGTGVNEILDFLSVILPECPKWVGFIVTSKPSSEFASLMPVNSLLDFSANNQQYLDDTMLLINEIANVFNDKEANQGKAYLREKSGGNFAYLVFTKQALTHPGMEGEDGYVPVDMLQDLPESLHAIYEEIFEDKFGQGRNRLWRKAQPVLELIVSAASGPYPQITEHQVMETLKYSKDEVRMLRRAFIDVVSIRQGTYSIISSAMYDWLAEPARQNEHFFVDVQLGVKTLKAFLRGEASSHHVIKDTGDDGDRITTIKLRAPLSSLTDSNSSSGSSNDGSPKTRQGHKRTKPAGILKRQG